MRSVAFFIGVFCAGLVIFLLFTGQISTLFVGGSGDESTREWEVKRKDRGPNRVSHTAIDPSTGRVRFTLSGNLDDEALSVDQVDAPTSLSQAVVKIPIQRPASGSESADPDAASAGAIRVTEFELSMGRISYRPHSEAKHFEMRGGIEGRGDDGSRFRTDSIDAEFTGDRAAQLVGRDPVEVSFPAFRLFGTNGFAGTIDSQLGLTRLTIAAPVVVALDRTHGGALLGLGSTAVDSGVSDEQIFLISKGPLVIDRARNEAVFEGEVVVFPASASATLNPAPEPIAAQSRFECEGLRLAFDPATVRFVEAEARRGLLPVRGFLTHSSGGTHELNADGLVWNESTGRVDLDGDVSIQGSRGRFRSRAATVFPRDRRVELWDHVLAELRSRMSNAGEVDLGSAPQDSDWIVSADRAVFTYGARAAEEKKKGTASAIESLRAWSDQPGKLLIRERRDDGARVEGSYLTYEARSGRVQITGPEEAPSSLRPSFKNGRSRVGSDRMIVGVDDRTLEFLGATQGEIYGWDLRKRLTETSSEAPPTWLQERGPEDYADVRCESLRLRWGAGSELEELVASGASGMAPMSLEIRGQDWCRCGGERFEWSRDLQRISLTGPPKTQTLESAFAKLSGERIDFDLTRLELTAQDTTEVHVEIPRDAFEPTPDGDSIVARGTKIVIDSPELRLVLVERPHEDERTKASAESKREPERESAGLSVASASAWNSRGGQVSVVDGSLAVAGQQVTWEANTQRIRLDGVGQQRIFRFGPDGLDELVADRIEVDMALSRAELDGQVRATIHQGAAPGDRDTPSPLGAPNADCEWQAEAGRVVVQFEQRNGARGDAVDSRLDLVHFEATRGVRVSQDAAGVVLLGTTATWDRRDQTLRILDPDGQARQTVQHGGGRNSIIARQLHVTPTFHDGELESVWVFMQDEVLGTFRPEQVPGNGSTPENFRLIADNLLVRLAPRSRGAVESGSAWGNVVFQGGDHQVFSSQVVYREAARELTFYGAPGEQVQIVHKGKASKGSERVTLRLGEGGGYTVELKASEPWRGDEIKAVMQQLEKEDRLR
ncbi:MAG: hypothetical protein AB7O52_06530 [Planctomycetota bacterium]